MRLAANDASPRSAEPRIALVGPVTPFRGGIAHYTTALHRALSLRSPVRTWSFRRQYPAWLYPGASDREPGLERHREPGVEYTLDALSPLSWIKTARQIAEGGCDLAVLSWWTLFWSPAFALIARMLRNRGIPVALLCHNLSDHDGTAVKRVLSTRLLGEADAYVVHAEEQERALEAMYPEKRRVRHPHPTYDRFPAPTVSLPRRGRLELLFFGFIRPYKGLDILVRALAELQDPEVFLTVVGEPWCAPEALRQELAASGAPNVELHLSYVDDRDAANYFARADLVVLPYRSATGSGVAALAYHYDCPILATRVGGLKDVVQDGATGFLFDPDHPEELAERLRRIDRRKVAQMREAVRTFKARFTWESLANALIALAKDRLVPDVR